MLNLFKLPHGNLKQHSFFTFVKVLCLTFAVYYIAIPPAPGKAVIILAIAAGAASLHPEQEGWQKALWIAVMCICMSAEFRAITKDRATAQRDAAVQEKEHERQFLLVQQEQNSVLSAALNGFSNEVSALQKMTRQIGDVAGVAGEAVNRLTAQGSTPCASFKSDSSYGDAVLQLDLYNDGKYPLYNVDVEVSYSWKERPPTHIEFSTPAGQRDISKDVLVLGNTPEFWALYRVVATHVFPVVHQGTPERLHMNFSPKAFDDGSAGTLSAVMRTQNGIYTTTAEIRKETEYMKNGVFNPEAMYPWDIKFSTIQVGPNLGGKRGYVGFKRLKACDSKGWIRNY